jgi:predicted outer membrane repeat protein
MHNVTFGKNSAGRNGGGIYHDGTAAYWEVTNITVAQNTAASAGGGMYEAVNGGGTKEEGNNIFAYNSAPQGADLWGDFPAWSGPDVILSYYGTVPSNYYNNDPQLAKFQSVNGLPKVYPLLPGSVAIDGANGGPAYDQRGGCRPLGAGYDIGAFEYDPSSTYLLVSVNSGMALDDSGSSRTAGQQMKQWTVNNGSNQAWTLNLLQRNRLGGILRRSNRTYGRAGITSNGPGTRRARRTTSTSSTSTAEWPWTSSALRPPRGP